MSIIYLPTKSELELCIDNGNLLSDRKIDRQTVRIKLILGTSKTKGIYMYIRSVLGDIEIILLRKHGIRECSK